MLRFNLNGGLYHNDYKSAELNISNSGLYGYGYINAQLTLPKDFRINAGAQYQSKMISLQGTQSALYIATFAMNKDFLNKKMTVTLTCTNPFSKYLHVKSTTSTEYFAANSSDYLPMQEVRLSISYRFGTMKEAIKKVQRGISNDDVKGGGGGGESGGS
jgi:hypothetical protein